jgi:molecular chaperone GrpE
MSTNEEEKINLEEENLKEENPQETEITNLKNELMIALADTENLRKRHAKEREELVKFAMSSALSKLAVPFENLFSALKLEIPEDLKENSFIKSMVEGVVLVQKDFEKVFNELGVKRIYPEGEKFNPVLHQAISQIEIEGFASGDVVQVVSAGVELNGRVIKPAMVAVAK